MARIPFNGANPSSILDALYRDLEPEQVVSLQLRCKASGVKDGDSWRLLAQVLSQPAVYAALDIDSIPNHVHFQSARGFEVIGTVANLLRRGGIHQEFVRDNEEALAVSRAYLDVFFQNGYAAAEAYSCHEPWCRWFIGEGVIDETILIRNWDEWWLLAVTATD
jgi:hypothetical protein